MTGVAATNESWMLAPEQLTGRSRSHVVEVAHLGLTLHPDAARAFLGLCAAAAAEGMLLVARSSFRDFDHQVAIWNAKFLGRRPLLNRDSQPLDRGALSDEAAVEAILTWSALPGASRHHWGTEVDVIDGSVLMDRPPQLIPQEFAPDGPFSRLNDWLQSHAAAYGFYRPYDVDRGGVQPEPWHISYAPVSDRALPALTVEVLAKSLEGVDLAGGEVVARRLGDIHARYVATVAPADPVALAARSVVSPAARPS